MSIPASVDGDAPVRAHHETDINAPLDTVWQLHVDVNEQAGQMQAVTPRAVRKN